LVVDGLEEVIAGESRAVERGRRGDGVGESGVNVGEKEWSCRGVKQGYWMQVKGP
jgi:hypothetical protein